MDIITLPAGERIEVPGIYKMTAEQYHADPCPSPSLSNSISKLLLERSPLHAATAHPRLNPKLAAWRYTDAVAAGAILHRMMSGDPLGVAVIEAADYKTGAAKAARIEAERAGLIPMLAHKLAELQSVWDDVSVALRFHPACASLFEPGVSEAVIAWREGSIWCRAMIDRLPDNPDLAICDLKFTSLSAAPIDFERSILEKHVTQGPFYLRGLEAVRGVRPRRFQFVVCETVQPCWPSVMCVSGALDTIGANRVQRAINRWSTCLATQVWPGYSEQVAEVEPPVWWLRKEEALLSADYQERMIAIANAGRT